ncbi:extracellular solute-binding protein [candidate division KSB3 bacterium]|uniref:Extracellular solute-binding protein n=1 Tax=candidate division KSB3 bacterium TaxID=2044937 RepID=A0A9D5JWC7_9BACT|nr:extracellular solute-binding protein [candidate division KSB3 bacterium]MBD3325338.1 extracellular solute-binding protein [candidate division KSB3 bacterium]
MKSRMWIAGLCSVLISALIVSLGIPASAQEKPYAGVTLNVLMEDVPDTESIEPLLPEFEEETGIKVVFEKVVYTVMHEKLVPQLMAGEGNGSYDFLQVDNYWVGEFVMAGWLRPLDEHLEATPEIQLDNYIQANVEMFTVGDQTYFIPQWTYPMGLVYRTDVVNDPEFHEFYEQETGQEWSFPPKDLFEYAEMAKAANDFTPDDVYGAAMQGAKIDPLVMELSNYLFALGGDFYDRTEWKATFDSQEGIDALKVYKDLLENAAQPGASGANFDDAFNVFGQGKAVFAITYNFLMPWLLDETNSVVHDRVEFIGLPGGGLLGGWAWAIPVSSPHPEAAWEFIKWVEQKEVQKARGMGGGMPAVKWIYDDPEFLDKYTFQKHAGEIIATGTPVPVISQSTRMVEIIGEYASSALIGDMSIEEALQMANEELNEIIDGDPLVEMQKQ